LLIYKSWVNAVGKDTFATYIPTTGKEICQEARVKNADVDLAVAGAKQAFQDNEWTRTNPAKRRNLLLK
jgi:acyl-CoA reductase-like NAD-dependent aldehyde dehydrogenase